MSKIRESARGRDCTMRIPTVCNGNPETTVWAHENSYATGKGMGIKAHDEHGCYACYNCHAVYDRQMKRPAWLTMESVENYFYAAKAESRIILKREGLI